MISDATRPLLEITSASAMEPGICCVGWDRNKDQFEMRRNRRRYGVLWCEDLIGWDAGIRSHSRRAEGESGCDRIGVAATNEAEGRMKWLAVRDDFRNWLVTAV